MDERRRLEEELVDRRDVLAGVIRAGDSSGAIGQGTASEVTATPPTSAHHAMREAKT